ncbi:L-serine ammonia-lyase, iron-sulfur-dependent subunit beta [Anaerocolumna sp. MB42-C2]|uniref:L-serine ammonia-lyase, iron-sulfur-dependent subunit beta n=1 Tax=Anaerocolumna sp. MB42-C2 TaxID=3070997 RepID=UPI002ED49F63
MLGVFDIIGPIMIGPSSSHTAGAVRIGKYTYLVLGESPVRARIGFSGSFAKTYRGHGTDKAIIAGILGMDTDDSRICNSLEIAKGERLDYTFETLELDGVHPNTVDIDLEGASGRRVNVRGSSVGGGNILINKINGADVLISGKSAALIITHLDMPGMVAKVSNILGNKGININKFSLSREEKGGIAIMTIEIDGGIEPSIQQIIQDIPNIKSVSILNAI